MEPQRLLATGEAIGGDVEATGAAKGDPGEGSRGRSVTREGENSWSLKMSLLNGQIPVQQNPSRTFDGVAESGRDSLTMLGMSYTVWSLSCQDDFSSRSRRLNLLPFLKDRRQSCQEAAFYRSNGGGNDRSTMPLLRQKLTPSMERCEG